jgi:hypothetical protein
LQVFFFTEKADKARLVTGLVRVGGGKVAHQATPLFSGAQGRDSILRTRISSDSTN